MTVKGRCALAVGLMGLAYFLSGCGKFFYGKPQATAVDFHADSAACVSEVGIPSSDKRHALVGKLPYKQCMLARGWTREQRVDTVNWYRGFEEDTQVIDVQAGPKQMDQAAGGSDTLCRDRHLLNRSAWRDNLPAYYACLGR